jgi:hypothetical protein
MKKKKLKKMVLNKSTISNLTESELNGVEGGAPQPFTVSSCAIHSFVCSYIVCITVGGGQTDTDPPN